MKVEKLVPEVYYKDSRDFSYIGRLLEVVFNYMKTSSELVNFGATSKNANSNLIDLLATSVGFESKHKYTTEDLIAIISTFQNMVRNKGTVVAFKEALQTLLTSQKIETTVDVDNLIYVDGNDKLFYHFIIPYNIKDTVLLEDLFEYILPSGVLYQFEYGMLEEGENTTPIKSTVSVDKLKYEDSINLGRVANTSNVVPIHNKEYDGDRSNISSGVVVRVKQE